MNRGDFSDKISIYGLIIISLATQLILLPFLLARRSEPADILGFYSYEYAAFLLLSLLLFLAWIILGLFRVRFYLLLQTLPKAYAAILIISSGLVLLFCSSLTLSKQIIEYLSLHWLFFALLFSFVLSDNQRLKPYWKWAILIFTLGLFCCIAIFSLIGRPYSPDEALWGALASSWRLFGKTYHRTSFDIPFAIPPGRGWISWLYGEVQWLFDFDLRVGRAFNLVMYLLGTLGLWLLSARLYGRKVAGIAVLLAIWGTPFFRVFDYRPDHFIIFPQTFTFWLLVLGRQASGRIKPFLLNFLVGLFATLALNLHLIALVFVLGFSLFYTVDFLWQLRVERHFTAQNWQRLLGFGFGAALGAMVYYLANIQSVGGLSTFMAVLLDERGATQRVFEYLTHWPLVMRPLLWGSLLFIVYRRNSEDKLYLSLFLCSLLCIILVDTQGYTIPYQGLFLLPMTVFIAEIFSKHFQWAISIILIALLPTTLAWIGWDKVANVLEQGALPESGIEILGKDILTHLELNGEVVLVTHELIWVLPAYEQLYSPMAEGVTATQRDWTGTTVWDTIMPDIYIEIPQRHVTPPNLAIYLEREDFVICESFQSTGYLVNIWRRTCE